MTSAPRRRKKLLLGVNLVVITVVATAACSGTGSDDHAAQTTPATDPTLNEDQPALGGVMVEVRRDPGCGCCTSWVEYLRKHGATVELTDDVDRASFRAARGIGGEAASCHTAVIEGYVVEGHVPVSAIQRLLADRPDAVGLALPGMPRESPGMGGDSASWERLAVLLVDAEGGHSTYDYYNAPL